MLYEIFEKVYRSIHFDKFDMDKNTLRTIVGVIDDNGLFPGRMKLAGEGGGASPVVLPGMEKSSISLLRMMPVLGDMNLDPKYELTVVVIETALRWLSTMEMWLVP